MSNLPRNPDEVRKRREENTARLLDETERALKRHISEQHHAGRGLLAQPPDPAEAMKQTSQRFDALRMRLTEEKKENEFLTATLTERVANLEAQMEQLRREVYFGGQTRSVWPEPPEDFDTEQN